MGKVGMGKTQTHYSKRKDQCEKWVQCWSNKEHQGCEHKGINGEPAQDSTKGTNPYPPSFVCPLSSNKSLTKLPGASRQWIIYTLAHLAD